MTPGSFTTIPLDLANANVSCVAKTLYLILRTCLNHQTGQCNPHLDTLAKRLHVSERTVSRGLRELRRTGWLESKRGLHGWRHRPREVPLKPAVDMNGECPVDMNGECPVDMNGEYETPASLLTELDDLNQRGDRDAAAKGRSCTGSANRPKAAAAASSPPSHNSQKPNTPPADESQKPPVAREVVTEGQDVNPELLAAAMTDKLLEVHPQPGMPARAREELAAILWAAGQGIEATAELIWTRHEAWMKYWATLEEGKFIPMLWRWLKDRDWQQVPVIRKPARRETVTERAVRESFERAREREQQRQQEHQQRRRAC